MGLPFWNVPHSRNPVFTAREDVLTDLRARFTDQGGQARIQAFVGLGGIGKTQTAVEYAYRYRDAYEAILWFNAESLLEFKAECGEVARAMRLPHPEGDLDQAVIALRNWLGAHDGWLVVLDNLDDPATSGILLPNALRGHVIITARTKDLQELGILDPFELAELSADDATAFLLSRCGREAAETEERRAAEWLARELGGLPLALEQAAAYIKANGVTFQRYLESFRNGGLGRLEARRPALGSYPKSVVTTWAANFAAVQKESPAAADVLRLTAFLAPDAIPFELMSRGASEIGPVVADFLGGAVDDPLRISDLIQPLGRFSLIRIRGEDESYGIHRLVQAVVRDAMDEATRRLWAERAVRAVAKALPDVDYANWPVYEQLLPHALTAISWLDQDKPGSVEVAGIATQAGIYLWQLSQFADAEPLLQKAVEIGRTTVGERHPDYAASLNNLGGLYRETNQRDKAVPLFQEAMEIRRDVLGERHPLYAASLNNMGLLYRELGELDAAEPLLRRATEIRREALGERHPDYAASLNSLALLYRETGRLDAAEALLRRAMEIRRKALGERHPLYAVSLNNLGALCWMTGRFAAAVPLIREAMEIRRDALGERHPDYAVSLANLGRFYRETGRFAAAVPLIREAMEIRRETLGEQDPLYAELLKILASLERVPGRHEEPENLETPGSGS